MDVIPLILSEELAMQIPDDFLARLAECSTNIVQEKVVEYLNNPKGNKECQEKVRKAYAYKIALMNYLTDESVAKKVDTIKDLSYTSITASLSVEQLQEYKDNILFILNNEYSVPYIAPIKSGLVKDLRIDIRDHGKATDNYKLIMFSKDLERYSQLFRDSQHEGHKGTIVKKIVRNRWNYELFLRGINFLLDKKAKGANPASWRYL